MKRVVPIVAAVLTMAFAACAAPEGSEPASGGRTDRSKQALAPVRELGRETGIGRQTGIGRLPESPKCKAPHEAPVWTPPADDGIAFGSLLEGAGYGADTNSDWVDIASGNFCGGAEKELVLLKNRHSNFSIMRGPTPYPVGAFDNQSDDAHPWRTVTAGDLDGDSFDEIVAVRKVPAAGVPDVLVMKVDPACGDAKVTQSATVGGVGASDWLDAAVGNFDGTGKKIALLKAGTTSFYLLGQKGSNLSVEWSSDLGTNAAYPWKGIAAGDLDGDGIDELVATRKVDDGKGTTVFVYRWAKGSFRPIATGTFGNDGNSDWAGVSIGDFNGDRHGSIALVKNKHSNFALLDLPAGSLQLRTLATSDLDSVDGQEWRGVTAVDWLGGDNDAAELIPVRAARGRYRADLFVYGNPFHRVARDSGIAAQRAEWDHHHGVEPASPAEAAATLKGVKDVHANMVSFTMAEQGDYDRLVAFLEATKGDEGCVEGQQVRVSATVAPVLPKEHPESCVSPQNSAMDKGWKEEDLLSKPNLTHQQKCLDFVGWARIFGRLARDYPNLVSMGVDDLTSHTDTITGELVAEMQAQMRQLAPWMTFAPIAYWRDMMKGPPDMGRTLDNVVFYFRNEKSYGLGKGDCIKDPCAVGSVPNVASEIADVVKFLPAGRKLNVGTYWGSKGSGEGFQVSSTRYNYDLGRFLRSSPVVDSLTIYPMQVKPDPSVPTAALCNERNFLDEQTDQYRFCTAERIFGMKRRVVTDSDLTSASAALPAAGSPFAYVFAAHGVQNIVYRATDNHAHELWRTSAGIGHSDLTALGAAPNVQGDPTAYVFAAHDEQTVVYRGADNDVHGLSWSWGGVHHDNLTQLAGAPPASASPFGYVFDAIGFQNVLYRATDGHLHGLYWSTGAVGHDDLTQLSGGSAPTTDNPFGYVFDAVGKQNALYRGNDGRLHGLFWSTGAVGHDDLTTLSGAPAPAAGARAYVAPTYGLQNARVPRDRRPSPRPLLVDGRGRARRPHECVHGTEPGWRSDSVLRLRRRNAPRRIPRRG